MISFQANGAPITQGSKTGYVINGRAVLKESRSKALHFWRDVIAERAQNARDGVFWTKVPIRLTLRFWIAPPQSLPKRRRTWPIGARSGDVDKLARAAMDALTQVLFADDAEVVELHVYKDWAQGPAGVTVDVEEVLS